MNCSADCMCSLGMSLKFGLVFGHEGIWCNRQTRISTHVHLELHLLKCR